MLIFFKCDIKFESSIMSAPCMIAFVTPKFEETFLNSFNNCEFLIVPLIVIFSHKEPSESFLRCPFNRNPFQSLGSSSSACSWWTTVHWCRKMWNYLNWNFSINVVFNLFNWWVRSKIVNHSIRLDMNNLNICGQNLLHN